MAVEGKATHARCGWRPGVTGQLAFLLSLYLGGCALSGGVTGGRMIRSDEIFSYGGSVDGQVHYGHFFLDLHGRVLDASGDGGLHGRFLGGVGLSTWRMPGLNPVEVEAQFAVGYGGVPLEAGGEVAKAFLLGPRLAVPLRISARDPLWHRDGLVSYALYLVPDITFTAFHTTSADLDQRWRTELSLGLSLRVHLYMSVVP